jgi:hypothetical protein
MADLKATISSSNSSLTAAINPSVGLVPVGVTKDAATRNSLGINNVTNESKATMFTDPTFTGTPIAPTATAGTNTTQIATTEFVTSAVQSEDTIAEMNDVTLTSLADGELLVSSSGNFINQTLAEAGIDAITLTTAAQPNITSVGTLTALTSSGQLKLTGVSASSGLEIQQGFFNGGGIRIKHAASADNEFGITYEGNTASGEGEKNFNLELKKGGSVLSTMKFKPDGNTFISTGNFGINKTSPSQALDVTGNIAASGSITGATLAGTLSTAAQTNITSVGTLTSLTVSGDVNVATAPTAGNHLTNKTYVDAQVAAKQNALTFGLANTNAVKMDNTSAAPFGGDIAIFASAGIMPKTFASLKSDLGVNNKAPLANPIFTGNPQSNAAPTSNDHLTNKTYVDTQVAGVVNSAPEALNTLNELAAALGDDANFATTTATAIGQKQDTLTFGIANTNAVKMDNTSAAPGGGDLAMFASAGIMPKTFQSLKSDMGIPTLRSDVDQNITDIAGKQDTLTFGIANTNAVKMDNTSAAPGGGDLAMFASTGIMPKTFQSLKSDLGVDNKAPINNPSFTGNIASSGTNPKITLTNEPATNGDYLELKASNGAVSFIAGNSGGGGVGAFLTSGINGTPGDDVSLNAGSGTLSLRGDAGITAFDNFAVQGKLHVKDTSAGNVVRQIRIHNDSTTSGTGTGIAFTNSTSETYVNASIDSIRASSSAASGNLVFSTRPDNTGADGATIARMTINDTGEVGIGKTAEAGYELDVQGEIRASGGVSAGGNLAATGSINGASTIGSSHYVSANFPTSSSSTTTAAFNLSGNLVQDERVIVIKVAGTRAQAMTTTASTFLELIPAPGANKVLVIRELEIFIDRGSWTPMSGGQLRGWGNNLQLVVETPANTVSGYGSSGKYNTFATFQKKFLNHTINGVFVAGGAVDTIIVRDAPATQTRAYPNVPLLLRPEGANTYANLNTYSQTVDDNYFFRITYKIMDMTSDFVANGSIT